MWSVGKNQMNVLSELNTRFCSSPCGNMESFLIDTEGTISKKHTINVLKF